MITTGLTSSLSDEWTTPRDLFQDLNSEFAFTLDVASTHENALCEHHFTKDENGLTQTWAGNVFCNPPYGKQIAAWMKKAAETNEGGVVVCLVPARTDTAWWHDYVTQATEVRFLRGRLKFGGGKQAAPFPSAIVIYDKRPKKYWKV